MKVYSIKVECLGNVQALHQVTNETHAWSLLGEYLGVSGPTARDIHGSFDGGWDIVYCGMQVITIGTKKEFS